MLHGEEGQCEAGVGEVYCVHVEGGQCVAGNSLTRFSLIVGVYSAGLSILHIRKVYRFIWFTLVVCILCQ